MILVLRGHIRGSFRNLDLYSLIETLCTTLPNVKIFIHTWNVFASSLSWRPIEANHEPVTEETIYSYFGPLSPYIKHIMIDDDTNIVLHGNLEGLLFPHCSMPIRAWKNYWYGKHKIIEYIYNQNDKDKILVSMRFDVLFNSCSFPKDLIVDFVHANHERRLTKNLFYWDFERNGMDNMYLGTVSTMYILSKKFYYELDEIVSRYNDCIFQERLLYHVNKELFDLPKNETNNDIDS